MRYLLLINKDEKKYDAMSDAQKKALEQRYLEWGLKAAKAGLMRGGAKLQHTPTATTVRVREGKRLVTDGPFAETTEQVAGIAFLECDNLDQALEWAASHPDAEWASVEVRPVEFHGEGPPGKDKP
jgi:hypothetical protein